jgi:hypothetical protein
MEYPFNAMVRIGRRTVWRYVRHPDIRVPHKPVVGVNPHGIELGGRDDNY